MTDREAVRVLVGSDDADVIEDFRHLLTPRVERVPDSATARLECELFGTALDHEAFPEVDLAVCRAGGEGVQVARTALDDERPFAIAFIDMNLAPGLDWLQTAEQMRAWDPNLQIVMLASRCDIHPLDLSLRIPPADRLYFLQKPLPALEVKQLVYVLNAKWRMESTMAATRRSAIRSDMISGRESVASVHHQNIATTVFDAGDTLLAANREFARLFPELAPSMMAGVSYEEVLRLMATRLLSDDALQTKDGWLSERLDWHARGGGTAEHCDREGRCILMLEHMDAHELTFCHFLDVTDLRRRDQSRAMAAMMMALAQAFAGLCERFEMLDPSGRLTCPEGPCQPAVERKGPLAMSAESKRKLIHGLLAVAQRLKLEPEPADLNRVLTEAIHDVDPSTRNGLDVRVVEGIGLWEVLIDKREFAEMLAELLRNAAESMSDSGGYVMIEASNARLSREFAAVHGGLDAGDYVRVTVADSGPGMIADLARRALNPFFTSKKGTAHHGLGLSAAYGFVSQSGGQLELHSTVGEGTRVELYLPRLVAPTDKVEANTEPEAMAPAH